ncbi:MAG: stage 0 sporulation protein [Oscillospiraceae bacterium]|nr:stage 0 sporulation protein [Oscillospiraceae bacterium]
MIEVIGVKFKSGGKMYYFAPGDLNPAEGSYVVVETARGPECGEVAARRHAVADENITAPLKPILRLATDEDMEILEKNRAYMAEAMRVCEERIAARELPMHLVDVECGFDSNKLIFYFTAESRVDFRELVKDLALAFHVRIELRQIGDRDEAKLLGGLGICGREFCCKGYLNNFQPISIKMAKEQGLALNPTKISGACGRLMCCLRYESPVYEELIKLTPKVGSTVILPGEVPHRAYVMEANLVTGNLRVKPENSDVPITIHRDQVERLQDASRRMTREDLRDKRTAPAKPEAQPQQKNTAQAKQEKQEKQEKPNQQLKQPRPPKSEQKSAESSVPQSAVLHPEFGENRQRSGAEQPKQPKPARAAMPLDDMDFTEHRAVIEHPERSAAQNQKQGDGTRRPNRNNRRWQNHRGQHRQQNTGGKPQSEDAQ